ncbi:MAG: hypothetical protein HC895_23170, partial [Leptolyngbyaceae cyanobacterium SM1_3_5]|nr:hypothetical protein [Leptolyngbyaceae cyanobacterium SM1_3_5]
VLGGSAQARSIAQAAGCDDFLVRPLHETQIRVTIKKYLDSNQQNDAAPVAAPNLTDLRQQLRSLPNSWIATLHQAALEGDRDWMLSLVAEIRPQHEPLAERSPALPAIFSMCSYSRSPSLFNRPNRQHERCLL